ncbi:EpsG family protein [Fibrobacter succinogenes]|uniref:EpsG family protein n=1 Tax=Fibrobacter succinogenes TaxID=833 RepID=A0A380S7W5_FIBSU|nr:EpsG-like putative glucosyltransferase [Fibrobacter succinogenes subsp. elongatus]SUQ24994.1 EpsG family protein [Fibrobacter succinogenes]
MHNRFLNKEKLGLLLLFLINSFAGWLFCTVQLFFDKKKRYYNLSFWAFLSIILISLFNATKVPENDLEWYSSFYLMAGKYSLSNYMTLLTGGKEPLYQMIVYFLHLIGGDNVHFFTFSISFMSYFFLLKTLFLWKKEFDISDTDFILCIAVLCFFPLTYALSVHIIRQFLALSIMLWSFFSYQKTRKKLYLCTAICDVFIHSSVVIFIPFMFFIKIVEKPIKLKYLYVGAFFIAVMSSIKTLSNIALQYVSHNKTLYHITKTAVDGTTFETELPQSQFLFSIFLVTLGFICSYWINPNLKQNKFATAFLNFSLFLIIFIAINKNFSEIQLRYNFYFWSFISFFTMLYLSSLRIQSCIKQVFTVVLFILWNFYNLFLSQWTYTCSYFYFIYPSFWYFLN